MRAIEVRAIWYSEKSTEEIEKFESLGIALDDKPEEEYDDITIAVDHIVCFYPTTNPERTRIFVTTAGDFLIAMPYQEFREKYLEAIAIK